MKVTIEGVGVFNVKETALPSLMNVINQSADTVKLATETTDTNYDGNQLIHG